jgi:uncharacterized protein YggL (DUF469 family)
MSPDPALHDGYPFVIIDREKFYYGKDPEYGKYIVAHEYDGKRYWYFEDDEQAMLDFLENLPESARPPMLGGWPIWHVHGTMPQEEYDQIFEAHRAYLRLLLEKRRKHKLVFDYRTRAADSQ